MPPRIGSGSVSVGPTAGVGQPQCKERAALDLGRLDTDTVPRCPVWVEAMLPLPLDRSRAGRLLWRAMGTIEMGREPGSERVAGRDR